MQGGFRRGKSLLTSYQLCAVECLESQRDVARQTKALDHLWQADQDGNKTIDIEELKCAAHKLGFAVSDAEAENVFNETDLDKNRSIDYREFILVLAILYMLEVRIYPSQKLFKL
jgi:Ca2+-binding EF-hand superfamily protein